MSTLALDLGTKTGWALKGLGGVILSGTEDMSIPPKSRKAMDEGWERREDPRFILLFNFINDIVTSHLVTKIVFEDVLFSEYTYQTQLWATFRAAVWAQRSMRPHIAFGCLNTSTLKLVATGKGNATKQMMAAHALRKYPGRFQKYYGVKPNIFIETIDHRPVDDNEVDAFHLLQYFIQNE